ncbi:MAG: helix-turn-helix domain-containing protein [Pseudomonadales bacterium]|nr:helix-turn-helix domain-containing protein [Pseudomonadales bacterium]
MPGTGSVDGQTPGEVLRAAREARGLSRREVAEALNLLESTLAAIEEDDTARQPELVFLRGYVRNYARLLRLDATPLLAGLSKPASPPPTIARPKVPLEPDRRRVLPVIASAIAVLILVGVIVNLLGDNSLSFSGLPTRSQDTIAVDTLPVAEPANAEVGNTAGALPPAEIPQTSPPAAEGVAADLPAPLPTDPAPPISPDVASATDDPGVAGLPESPDQPTAAGGAAASTADSGVSAAPRRLNRGGDDRISLRFTADCYVRVKDIDGKLLFSDMGRSDRPLELIGKAPFDILLGYAPGVTLSFNDAPVSLAGHRRNNVATLVLGAADTGAESR